MPEIYDANGVYSGYVNRSGEVRFNRHYTNRKNGALGASVRERNRVLNGRQNPRGRDNNRMTEAEKQAQRRTLR